MTDEGKSSLVNEMNSKKPKGVVTFAASEDMSSNEKKELRDAEEVFIFMHRNFRVSRNIRAHWLFDHLNKTVRIDPDATLDEKYGNEMSVIGIIAKNGNAEEIVTDEDFLVTVDTKITYISRYYRHVFVLDLSPSSIVADDGSDVCLSQRILKSLRTSMISAVKGFTVPGTKRLFQPQIYAAVCVFVPFLTFEHELVLVQGELLTESNVHQVLAMVTDKFNALYLELYHFVQPTFSKWARLKRRYRNKFDSICEPATSACDENYIPEPPDKHEKWPARDKKDVPSNIMQYPRGYWSLIPDMNDSRSLREEIDGYIQPEWSLIFMLRIGLIATQMLPENTQSNVIVITDAVCGIPDAPALQKVLTQLRSYTIACSFIQLQEKTDSEPVFGHVASCELFHFLAMATFGTYLPNCSKCVSAEDCDLDCANSDIVDIVEHEEPLAVGMKSLQTSTVSRKSEEEQFLPLNSYHRALICWCFQNALADNEHITKTVMKINKEFALLHKQNVERHIRLSTTYCSTLTQLLYVRLREGFTLKSAQISEKGDSIFVVLCLPFRPLVFLEYTIKSPWPAKRSERSDIKVELIIEAPYNELKNLLTEGQYLDPARLNLTKSVIDGIIEADRLLLHIHSFNSDPAFYDIPKTLTTDTALFNSYNLANKQANISVGRRQSNNTRRFVDFWRVLLELDDSTWQKWVHTHSERLLLSTEPLIWDTYNDHNDVKMDFGPAMIELHEFVMSYSSFCLVAKQTYVTFVTPENHEKPSFFYMTRVCSKAPCVVLKTAFLGGMGASVRRKIVDGIRSRLVSLKFRFQPDRLVVSVIRRPLERVLVRYRETPSTLRTIVRASEETDDEEEIKLITLHNAITKCLNCRRTIFVLADQRMTGYTLSSSTFTNYALNVLLQRRLAKEGFKPAWTENNIISMCRQTYSTNGHELEQFIFFPPTMISLCPKSKKEPRYYYYHPQNGKEDLRKVKAHAIVYEMWTEPGSDEEKRTKNYATPKEDVHLLSVLFTMDKLLEFCLVAHLEEQKDDTARNSAREKDDINETTTKMINDLHNVTSKPAVVPEDLMWLKTIEKDGPSHDDAYTMQGQSSPKSEFVRIYGNLFSLENLLQHAPKYYEFINSFAKESDRSTWCDDMLLRCLHKEFEELSINSEFKSDHLWAKLVRNSQYAEEFKTDVPCCIYPRYLSPWVVGIFILPMSLHKMRHGGIPVVMAICNEPQLAYCLATQNIKEYEEVKIPFEDIPNDWVPGHRCGWKGVQDLSSGYAMKSAMDEIYADLMSNAKLSAMFTAAKQGYLLLENEARDMAEDGEVIELEMETVPSALLTFCRHINPKDGVIPPPDQCCSDESNLDVLFASVVKNNFKVVPGTQHLYVCEKKNQELETRSTSENNNSNEFLSNFANASRGEESDYNEEAEGSVIPPKETNVERTKREHGVRRTSSSSDVPNRRGNRRIVEPLDLDQSDDIHLYKRKYRPIPLFIQFQCSVIYSDAAGTMDTFAIDFLPSCIHQVLVCSPLRPTEDFDITKVSVRLEILATTFRHFDHFVDALDKAEYPSDNGEGSLLSDMPQGPDLSRFLGYLPDFEKKSLLDLVKNMNALLELERVLTESRSGEVTEEKLKMISQFISRQFSSQQVDPDESNKAGNLQQKSRQVDLVIQSESALRRLKKRLDGLNLDYATLKRCPNTNMYYCCKVDDVVAFGRYTKKKKRKVSQMQSVSEKGTRSPSVSGSAIGNDSFSKAMDVDDPSDVEKQRTTSIDVPKRSRNVSGSSRQSRTLLTTDGTSKDTVELRRDHLFDFWLILTVDDEFKLQFCQRYKEQHNRLHELAWRKCRQTIRAINQELLLERMFETRECDQLLMTIDDSLGLGEIEEYHSEEQNDVKSEVDIPIDDRARYNFYPGYFACGVRKELWFTVPQRLRIRQPNHSSLLAFACERLRPAIEQFAVRNIPNTYVFKDTVNGNFLYMQLHIYEESYIAALKGNSNQGPKKKTIERVAHQIQTDIVMTIFGVQDPSDDICKQLEDAVQQRLDTLFLSYFLALFSKNTSMRLEAQDVHFLQRDINKTASNVYFSLPAVFQGYLASFWYYINQHMQAVMPIAKVKDEFSGTSGSRNDSLASCQQSPAVNFNCSQGPHFINKFQSFPPYEGTFPPNYSPTFYLYGKWTQMGSSDNGMSVIEIRIVNNDGSIAESLIEGRTNCASHSALTKVDASDRMTGFREMTHTSRCRSPDDAAFEKLSATCGFLQAIVWKVGSIQQKEIENKLQSVVEHAMCDVITEFGYLNTSIVECGAPIPSSPNPLTHFQLGVKRASMRKRDSYDGIHAIQNGFARGELPPAPPHSATSTALSTPTIPPAVHSDGNIARKAQNVRQVFTFESTQSMLTRRSSNASELDKMLILEDPHHKPCRRVPDYVTRKTAMNLIEWFDYMATKGGPEANAVVRERCRLDCFKVLEPIVEIVDRIDEDLKSSETGYLQEDVYLCSTKKPIQKPKQKKMEVGVEGNASGSTTTVNEPANCEDEKYEVMDIQKIREAHRFVKGDHGVDENAESSTDYIIIGYIKNVAIETLRYGFDPVGEVPETLKRLLEYPVSLFAPYTEDRSFVPRQKLMFGQLKDGWLSVYFYNFHPNVSNNLAKIIKMTSMWYMSKQRLLTEIGLHKMGITHLSPLKTSPENPYEMLVWMDPVQLTSKTFPPDKIEVPEFAKLPGAYADMLFRMYRQPHTDFSLVGRRTRKAGEKEHLWIPTMRSSSCLANQNFTQLKLWRDIITRHLNSVRTAMLVHDEFLNGLTCMKESDLEIFLPNNRNSKKRRRRNMVSRKLRRTKCFSMIPPKKSVQEHAAASPLLFFYDWRHHINIVRLPIIRRVSKSLALKWVLQIRKSLGRLRKCGHEVPKNAGRWIFRMLLDARLKTNAITFRLTPKRKKMLMMLTLKSKLEAVKKASIDKEKSSTDDLDGSQDGTPTASPTPVYYQPNISGRSSARAHALTLAPVPTSTSRARIPTFGPASPAPSPARGHAPTIVAAPSPANAPIPAPLPSPAPVIVSSRFSRARASTVSVSVATQKPSPSTTRQHNSSATQNSQPHPLPKKFNLPNSIHSRKLMTVLVTLINDYVKYLETLGYKVLNVTQLRESSKVFNRYKTTMREDGPHFKPYIVLYKCLKGGFVFVTLTFEKPDFDVRVHSFCRSEHPYDGNKNDDSEETRQQDEELREEIKNLVDHCHVESFIHDFHLRILSKHLVGKQTSNEKRFFNEKYNTINLLSDFLQYYDIRPENTRNCVSEDRLSQELENGVTGDDVWNYMNARYHELGFDRVVKLKKPIDELKKLPAPKCPYEFMLVHSTTHNEKELLRVVIYDKQCEERNTENRITLLFFNIIVDNYNADPLPDERDKDGRIIGEFKVLKKESSVADTEPFNAVAERDRILNLVRCGILPEMDEVGFQVARKLFGLENCKIGPDTVNEEARDQMVRNISSNSIKSLIDCGKDEKVENGLDQSSPCQHLNGKVDATSEACSSASLHSDEFPTASIEKLAKIAEPAAKKGPVLVPLKHSEKDALTILHAYVRTLPPPKTKNERFQSVQSSRSSTPAKPKTQKEITSRLLKDFLNGRKRDSGAQKTIDSMAIETKKLEKEKKEMVKKMTWKLTIFSINSLVKQVSNEIPEFKPKKSGNSRKESVKKATKEKMAQVEKQRNGTEAVDEEKTKKKAMMKEILKEVLKRIRRKKFCRTVREIVMKTVKETVEKRKRRTMMKLKMNKRKSIGGKADKSDEEKEEARKKFCRYLRRKIIRRLLIESCERQIAMKPLRKTESKFCYGSEYTGRKCDINLLKNETKKEDMKKIRRKRRPLNDGPIMSEDVTCLGFVSNQQRKASKELEDLTTQYRLFLKKVIDDAQVQCKNDKQWKKARVLPLALSCLQRQRTDNTSAILCLLGLDKPPTSDPTLPRNIVRQMEHRGFSLSLFNDLHHLLSDDPEHTNSYDQLDNEFIKNFAIRRQEIESIINGVNSHDFFAFFNDSYDETRCEKYATVNSNGIVITDPSDENVVVLALAEEDDSPSIFVLIKETSEDDDLAFKLESIIQEVYCHIATFCWWNAIKNRLEDIPDTTPLFEE